MGAAASVVIAPVTGGIGYGLTYIKDRHSKEQFLPGNVKKVTKVVETRKTARIFAGIFTCGLTELMNHKSVSEEYFYEDEFIGSNETGAAEELNRKGNEFYKKGDYEHAATCFAGASDLTKKNGKISEKYKENLKISMQKIKEAAERREREEAIRGEREKAERIKREEAERIKREEAERIKREEAEKQAREEALQLERARNRSKFLQEQAANIYQQAEALSSVELKLEKYETAIFKCEEACASGASEEVFNTLNKIFESCLKHGAHDEAEDAVQIVRKYFPSETGRLESALVSHQNESWSPDYESRACREQKQQEQYRTIVITLA